MAFSLDAALARAVDAVAKDLQPGSLAERACAIQALEWRDGYGPVPHGEAGAWARGNGLLTGSEEEPSWTEFAGHLFVHLGIARRDEAGEE